MPRMTVVECVRESNRIENITRPPTLREVEAHERFVRLEAVTVADLQEFVSVYQPDARLRIRQGMNVRVGKYSPPEGSPLIETWLKGIIRMSHAFHQHVAYETLHPFTDGNGRSGRALWYWAMRNDPQGQQGFLHAFYYQTLQNSRHFPEIMASAMPELKPA